MNMSVVGRSISLALAALCGTLLLPGCGSGEPEFKEKPASQWLKQMQDKNPTARKEALEALKALKMSEPLSGALKDEDDEVRALAADYLGKVGPEARQALPALVEATKDKDKNVRCNAARALAQIDPNEKTVTTLNDMLKDPSVDVRLIVVDTLGSIGPAAKPALPALRGMLKNDKDSLVRTKANKAIETIEGRD